MPTADVRFGRYKDGLPHAAHVVLTIECPSSHPGIELDCLGQGFIAQGSIEEVPATGYEGDIVESCG